MEDGRLKQIMNDLGVPDSHSLYCALQEVANESAQEVHFLYSQKEKELNSPFSYQEKPSPYESEWLHLFLGDDLLALITNKDLVNKVKKVAPNRDYDTNTNTVEPQKGFEQCIDDVKDSLGKKENWLDDLIKDSITRLDASKYFKEESENKNKPQCRQKCGCQCFDPFVGDTLINDCGECGGR